MPENIYQYILSHRGSRYCPDDNFEAPNRGEPTEIQPGTVAKIAVMRARLERGEPLWVDGDRDCFDDPKL